MPVSTYSSGGSAKDAASRNHAGESGWREFAKSIALSAARTAVHARAEQLIALQKTFQNALDELGTHPSADALQNASQLLCQELERHNREAQEMYLASMAELKQTAKVLSDQIGAITGGTEKNRGLEAMESILAEATTADEVASVRDELVQAMQTLRQNETARKARTEAFLSELEGRILQLEETGGQVAVVPGAIAQVDSLTGLPDGQAAREAIVAAQGEDATVHLAIMYIQSLDVLNARYGQRIGDQIILTCCQFLASNLCREHDRMFRWRGPAFVALLQRDDSPAGVSREVAQVCGGLPSSFFGEPNRTILIPIRINSIALPLGSQYCTELFESIDRFILRSGRPTAL
jgi:GGDEF domain-containing protein